MVCTRLKEKLGKFLIAGWNIVLFETETNLRKNDFYAIFEKVKDT